MLVQVYAEDTLVYDGRLDEYRLLGLTATVGVDISGTATIIMPPGHPAYNCFTAFRTVVTIYRNGQKIFRGRSLPAQDDTHNVRTIICEGERGFLIDGVSRPYLYQGSPEDIFAEVIGEYNAQVEPFKQFKVGTVTVTDLNNYIRLESETAEQVSDTVNKLLERCGGYIVFSDDDAGCREISWLASVGRLSEQKIEFGENLLDFTRTGYGNDLATAIVPYGGVDEATGERVTIKSVNNGVDFIHDAEAVALRGTIVKPVYFEDVFTPENLLVKAKQSLQANKAEITSLELTAVDLSAVDQNIDSFQEGDTVPVLSLPHGVDDLFQLRQRSYDLLNPANDVVALGKEVATLTGSDVAGDKDTLSQLHRVQHGLKADYTLNIAKAIQDTLATMNSLIEQTSQSIKLEVSEKYATNEKLTGSVSSSMTQLSKSFDFRFTALQSDVIGNESAAREQFRKIESLIRLENGDIVLGNNGSTITLRVKNDRISILDNGAEVAYFSHKKLYVLDGHFLGSLRIGKFSFIPRENGNLSLVKVGE